MSERLTPLSVAFIWHMHQPYYKDDLTGDYLMPWVRLHAVKDYLDMVKMLAPFPKIRQTFNLVPSLIDQIQDYTDDKTHDRYSILIDKKAWDKADKQFILQRFFDAAQTLVVKSNRYQTLFHKRNQALLNGEYDITGFSEQDFTDIVALFNLVWIDPIYFDENSVLKALWDKGQEYTLADCRDILKIHREIIRETLPTYKAFQDKGQIEVTTTPYFHPILPLLIDSESARVAMPHAVLPEERFASPEDAQRHVGAAIAQYEKLFGNAPPGVWPAEQSISPAALKILKDAGFQWAVSSQGNLAHSLGITYEKDPFGNILNAEVLSRPYAYQGLNLLFRNLTLSDLIGFHYANLPAGDAAHDCYQRIKTIQRRCTKAGLAHPIVTIALDGENCWEYFPDDGHAFLTTLYTLLSEDDTLNVCRVKDYFEQVPASAIEPLEHVHSGSWINSNFHIWIADPVKNAAWTYLKKTRTDLATLTDSGHFQPQVLEQAWKEIYIAEGSDWFWWYGEPHHSGQDEIFDMQFRRHLANVYKLLNQEVPKYLDIPLTLTMGRPVVPPTGPIQPRLSGTKVTQEDWAFSGSYDLTHGAMHRGTRILQKVYFGSDDEKAYLRFELNHDVLTPYHELFIYLCTPGKTRHNSPVRIKTASGHTVHTQRFHYAYEIQVSNLIPESVRVTAAEALPDYLWCNRTDLVSGAVFEDVLDLSVRFDTCHVPSQEYLQFGIALVQGGILDEFQPADYSLYLERQAHAVTLNSVASGFIQRK